MSYVEATDTSLRKTGQIKLHGPSAFVGMRKAGALVAKCLDALTDVVGPGVPTSRIDEFVRDFAFSHGAYPATLMYRGYRYSTCTSLNHVVCHGMPGDRPLKEGDIVNIDVTFIVDGWYGDSSRMYAIGPIARKAERLLEATYEAMMRGIAAVKPGATTRGFVTAVLARIGNRGTLDALPMHLSRRRRSTPPLPRQELKFDLHGSPKRQSADSHKRSGGRLDLFERFLPRFIHRCGLCRVRTEHPRHDEVRKRPALFIA